MILYDVQIYRVQAKSTLLLSGWRGVMELILIDCCTTVKNIQE